MKLAIWILAGLFAAGPCEAKEKFAAQIRDALQGSSFYRHPSEVRDADELFLGYDAAGRLTSAVVLGPIQSSARVTALVRALRQETGAIIDRTEILDIDKIKNESNRQAVLDMAAALRGTIVPNGGSKGHAVDAVSGATAYRNGISGDFNKLVKALAEAMAPDSPWLKMPQAR